MFNLIHQEIARSGYKELMAPGVVLTGRTSLLEGIVEVGEHILDLPVRVGYPNTVGGLSEIVKSPIYATAVGLVLYGRNHTSDHKHKNGGKNFIPGMTRGVKDWFAEVFC